MSTREELGIKSAPMFEQLMSSGITRSLTLTGAYDLKNALDGKNYGIHGMEAIWVVSRGGVAISWLWMLPLYLKHVRQSLNGKPYVGDLYDGLGDIGYHSPVPTYEGQSCQESCTYTGGKCYGDGTSLGAMELFDKTVGDPTLIWVELESRLTDLERQVQEQRTAEKNFS